MDGFPIYVLWPVALAASQKKSEANFFCKVKVVL
jgi:hypothetical protein